MASIEPRARPSTPGLLALLVVGGTIGSAVFMMPTLMAPFGGVGLLSLAAATLGALAVALTLASLPDG